jgi:hypothetical protein
MAARQDGGGFAATQSQAWSTSYRGTMRDRRVGPPRTVSSMPHVQRRSLARAEQLACPIPPLPDGFRRRAGASSMFGLTSGAWMARPGCHPTGVVKAHVQGCTV